MVFSLPLSIHLGDIGLGVGLSMPGEILIVFVLVGVVWRMIFKFEAYKLILFHPISLLLIAQLVWMFFCTITSVIPEVSSKYLLLKIIYLLVFYVYGARLFLESGRLKTFVLIYLLGLMPVVFFTWYNHYVSGFFSLESSNRNCYPFFNDHTIYAACLAMLLPLLYTFVSQKKHIFFLIISCILLTVGLYFSFSRAALVSVVVSSILFLFLFFRVKLKIFVISFVILLIVSTALFFYVKKDFSCNNASKRTDFSAMAYSILDSKNQSNIERYNRWGSAFKMFLEKPIVGFGPGTYMFVYGRYQDNKTEISVHDASMGGAHSEYLKPLSEEGFIGFVLVLVILVSVFIRGYQLSLVLVGIKRKILIGAIVGLSTYYVHGVFNFFLDTDKAAVLFWALNAYIVALDIRYTYTKEKQIHI